ncbi:MAG TPA: DUF4230 domain-containing protein [Candidatus Paceibacterota bacterium]
MKNIILITLVILIFLGGAWISYLIFGPSEDKVQINSQTILQSLQSRGFLVTETYTADQKVTIDNRTGSFWRDLAWGQLITASALMRVGLGIDLLKIRPEDITVSGNKARINLPDIEVQSVELTGEITLKNDQGILKNLLDSDDGYNKALEQLREEVKAAATSEEVENLARQNAEQEIRRLIGFLSSDLGMEFVWPVTEKAD